MLKKLPRNFYGDQFRWFMGIVVGDADPLRMGRIQVRIYGIHDDVQNVPDGSLPWAQALVPTTEEGVSGLGFKPNIRSGATVFGIFLDGNQSQLPFVLGSVPKSAVPNGAQVATTQDNNVCGVGGIPITGGSGGGVATPQGIVSDTTSRLIGGAVEEKIFNFFISRGLSAEQSAGIVGNFVVESNLDPAIVNPNDKGAPAYGLAQWRLDRYDGLVAKARSMNASWDDLGAQLEWTLQELPSNGGASLRAAKTVKQSTRAFMLKFERPAGTGADAVPSEGARIAAAQAAYDSYA